MDVAAVLLLNALSSCLLCPGDVRVDAGSHPPRRGSLSSRPSGFVAGSTHECSESARLAVTACSPLSRVSHISIALVALPTFLLPPGAISSQALALRGGRLLTFAVGNRTAGAR